MDIKKYAGVGAMTDDSELGKILDGHLQDIRAGHDSKLAGKLLAWRDRSVRAARIDTINQIRHSDQRLNHGTIELLGAMSQELNKQKLSLQQETEGE